MDIDNIKITTYAVIELVEYQIVKPSHGGQLNCLEVEKHFMLKFSGKKRNSYDSKFKSWCKERNCYWAWDFENNKMCLDSCELSDEFHCYCELMSNFLAEEGFECKAVGNIIHFFQKTENE